MAGSPPEDDNSRPTVAGCLLLLVSVAVIGVVAIPVVTWRDPQDGQPLPRMVAILTPVLAGALCYGFGAILLRLVGWSVFVPSKQRPARERDDAPR